MAIVIREPTVKAEERTRADGTKYKEYCICVWLENDAAQDVEGDVTFWGVYPGAAPHPIQGALCTETHVKVPKMVMAAHGQSKGRKEVCCCNSDGLVELHNTKGRVEAAWGRKDQKGRVTIEKADETSLMEKPVALP